MQSDESQDIEREVCELLKDIVGSQRQLRLTYRLVKDLKIDSDVLSFEFAIPLQEKLKIDVPDEEWLNIYTIEDAINLLKKYQSK
jgi:acyl carrier protein